MHQDSHLMGKCSLQGLTQKVNSARLREALPRAKSHFMLSGKGGFGGIVDIYQVDTWQSIAQCKGHTSFVRHLDWTENSQYLHSTDANPELLFWNASNGAQLKSGALQLKFKFVALSRLDCQVPLTSRMNHGHPSLPRSDGRCRESSGSFLVTPKRWT